MPAPRTILVTGAAGGLGTLMRGLLPQYGYRLRLLDLRPVEGEPEAVTADLTDTAAYADPNRDEFFAPAFDISVSCGSDTDNDGVPDATDNCPADANSSQLNTDAANTANSRPGTDSLGDACDDDNDGDGYYDAPEVTAGENPISYCSIMRADINGNGVVGFSDLLLLAAAYNQSVPPAPERSKQRADNLINFNDLLAFAQEYIKPISDCPAV